MTVQAAGLDAVPPIVLEVEAAERRHRIWGDLGGGTGIGPRFNLRTCAPLGPLVWKMGRMAHGQENAKSGRLL